MGASFFLLGTAIKVQLSLVGHEAMEPLWLWIHQQKQPTLVKLSAMPSSYGHAALKACHVFLFFILKNPRTDAKFRPKAKVRNPCSFLLSILYAKYHPLSQTFFPLNLFLIYAFLFLLKKKFDWNFQPIWPLLIF